MKNLKNIILFIALAAFVLIGNGCATASKKVSGSGFTTDRVSFESNVDPVEIRVEGITATTPCTLMLPSRPFWLQADKEHYLSVSQLIEKSWTGRGMVSLGGDIVTCVFPPVGAAALATDTATGSFTELPKVIRIELEPDPNNPPPKGKSTKRSKVRTR